MGDYIYAISHGGISVTYLESLEETDSHQFTFGNSNSSDETSSEVTVEDKDES